MKKFRIITILAALTLACAALALTGCKKGLNLGNLGYSAKVVYDFDGETQTGLGKRTFYYKPLTPIIKPDTDLSADIIIKEPAGYHFDGWYSAQVDEDGNPIKDGSGKYILSDEPWDFETGFSGEKNSVLYLVATWARNYTFTIDVGEEARNAGVSNTVLDHYSQPGPVSKPGGVGPKWGGHTFYYYYSDPNDDTSRIYDSDWSNIVISDENPDVTVYVKWLEGNWTIVTDKQQIRSLSPRVNYYLDDDIDFSNSKGEPTEMKGAKDYNGIFEGNGHKITNFKCTVSASPIPGETVSNECGLFASFGDNGVVRNVIFENCTVEVSLNVQQDSGHYYVGFLCGKVSANTKLSAFTGIKFKDCVLNVQRNAQAVDYSVSLGTGNYFGIFGEVADRKNDEFVIGDEDRGITVKLDNEIQK